MNKLIKELLACDDLLKHDKVVAAAEGLGIIKNPRRHATYKTVSKETVCSYCGRTEQTSEAASEWWNETCPKNNYPIPIPGSLADIAEEMRDACHDKGLKDKWEEALYRTNRATCRMIQAPLKYWIIAATATWWENQEVNHE